MGAAEHLPSTGPWALAEALGQAAVELAAYHDEPLQMASGAAGKTGLLRLGFERRDDWTVLAELESRAPCMAQRALYPEPALPDLAWLFMISTAGCVLQGDRLALEVRLAPGARAHVTTQSATKVHTMDANYAVQTQSIALADGAYLEFMPEPLIPHRGARYLADTRITIAPTATLLYSEILQPGRKHHHPDECFGATVLSLALGAERPDGQALFTEKLVIEPARRAMRQTGVMDAFDVFGNVVLLTPKDAADRIHARLDAEVDHASGLAFGACRLPNDAGLVFKVLGRETEQVKAKVREFWAIARHEITGTELAPAFFWR
ncbi:MAG TPA: urease accessory protein UreD [Burkholderiaceae bacterium]|nr:urease accessory protein UreD [Burkholderiaceae bacterium]